MLTNPSPIELKSAEDQTDPNELVTKALDGLTSDVNARFAKVSDAMNAMAAKLNRPGAAANDNAPNHDNDNEKKAFNTFLRKGKEALAADEVKAMTVAVDQAGGYLAPEEFAREIIKALRIYSPIRQYARVVGTSASEVKYPVRLSSTTATWVSEIADRTESELTYGQKTIAPWELATFVDVSTQLIEDNTYALESEVSLDLGETFGITESTAFVKGTGVGQPKGLFTATGIAEVKTGNAATLGTNPADTLIGMFHSLPSVHAQNSVWILNRTTLGTFRQLKDGQGRYIVLDGLTDGAPVTLLGRPIVECVDVDDIGAGKYPVMFGDLQGYRILDRVGLSILRDPYSLASKGQIRFHARRRVGGDLTHVDRFIKLKVSA